MKICLFSLVSRNFGEYFFIHLFLHNWCVLNSNLTENILNLVTFTLKSAKHKMATKKIRKPQHIKAQFMVSARFVIDNFFLVYSVRNYLYLTFKSYISAVCSCIYRYYKYSVKHVDENMTYLGFLKVVATIQYNSFGIL